MSKTSIQSRPLERSAFCPKKFDHTSGLTLHPGCNLRTGAGAAIQKDFKMMEVMPPMLGVMMGAMF